MLDHERRQQEIQKAAYLKWEAAGRPFGDGAEFWLEAERELAERLSSAADEIVEEASEESFPASDPPAWTPTHVGAATPPIDVHLPHGQPAPTRTTAKRTAARAEPATAKKAAASRDTGARKKRVQ